MYRKGLTLGVLQKQCELIEELVSKMEGSRSHDRQERSAYYHNLQGIVSNLKEIRRIQKNYQRYGKKNRVLTLDISDPSTYLIDY